MIRNGNKKLTYNSWLDEFEKSLMINYIQQKVNNWCVKHSSESFAAKTFFCGENYDWRGTPL